MGYKVGATLLSSAYSANSNYPRICSFVASQEEEKRLKLLVSAFRDMNYRSQNGAASFGNITHSLAGHHNRTSTSRQYIQPHGATYGSIASPGRLRELQRLKLLDQRPSSDDVPLMHYQPLERREQEYVQWLEQQLDKVQSFYTEKVQGMGNRLDTLRLQLRLILIGLIILIMLCPLRIFHYSSRRWFAYSYVSPTRLVLVVSRKCQ